MDSADRKQSEKTVKRLWCDKFYVGEEKTVSLRNATQIQKIQNKKSRKQQSIQVEVY